MSEQLSGPEMYAKLREMALDAVALGLPAPPEDHPDVSGVVIDVPADGGYATLVAMCDGTTSMYTSGGGGTLGAGQHEAVQAATNVLLKVLQAALSLFPQEESTAQPPSGRVRWFILTPGGRHVADMEDDVFWGRKQSPASPLAMAAQAVVSAMRQATPPE